MKHSQSYLHSRTFRTLFVCAFALFSFVKNGKAQETKLMVIANPNGCKPELKFEELKSIMQGEQQRWKNGTKIMIALMKSDTPEGMVTAKKVYGMTPDQLDGFWLQLVFQGKAKDPKFFESAADLENYVAKTPGAIGIAEIPEQSVTKPVLVDGKKTF